MLDDLLRRVQAYTPLMLGVGAGLPEAAVLVPITRSDEPEQDGGPQLAPTPPPVAGSSDEDEAEGADRDQGDGQACWNATRTESARRLAAWLSTDPTGTGSQRTVILGDLNSYAQEDPIQALAQAGWRDAFAVSGTEAPYSYAYRGTLGRLDHALVSPALAADLRGAAEWHANADEPRSAGYRDGGPGPWRSSDHDPLLLGFDLRR